MAGKANHEGIVRQPSYTWFLLPMRAVLRGGKVSVILGPSVYTNKVHTIRFQKGNVAILCFRPIISSQSCCAR